MDAKRKGKARAKVSRHLNTDTVLADENLLQ